MRSYEAARSLFSFLGFCAWCVIIIGGILALVGVSAASQYGGYRAPSGAAIFAGLLPGLALAMSGFLLLAFVQMGRASVDTAEYTQQMLKIARDQLEVSRQGLTGRKIDVPTFATQDGDTDAQSSPSFADAVASNADRQSSNGLSVQGQETEALPAPGQAKTSTKMLDYRGHEIIHSAAGFIAEGVHFETKEAAEQFIDERIKVDQRVAKMKRI